jgi:hypothetical protein
MKENKFLDEDCTPFFRTSKPLLFEEKEQLGTKGSRSGGVSPGGNQFNP